MISNPNVPVHIQKSSQNHEEYDEFRKLIKPPILLYTVQGNKPYSQ